MKINKNRIFIYCCFVCIISTILYYCSRVKSLQKPIVKVNGEFKISKDTLNLAEGDKCVFEDLTLESKERKWSFSDGMTLADQTSNRTFDDGYYVLDLWVKTNEKELRDTFYINIIKKSPKRKIKIVIEGPQKVSFLASDTTVNFKYKLINLEENCKITGLNWRDNRDGNTSTEEKFEVKIDNVTPFRISLTVNFDNGNSPDTFLEIEPQKIKIIETKPIETSEQLEKKFSMVFSQISENAKYPETESKCPVLFNDLVNTCLNGNRNFPITLNGKPTDINTYYHKIIHNNFDKRNKIAISIKNNLIYKINIDLK